MPHLTDEQKIIICSASIAYHNAKAIVDALDVMLVAVHHGAKGAQAKAYDAAIRPHAEAIIAAARGQGDDDAPDSPAAV